MDVGMDGKRILTLLQFMVLGNFAIEPRAPIKAHTHIESYHIVKPREKSMALWD
jgi:hypothetical protein